jgi:uncharacterized membrane protein YbhN (UPF0104 family)
VQATWRTRVTRIGSVVGAVLVVACVAFVARRLAHEWSAARDALGDASWSWIVLAVVAAGAAMTSVAIGWQRVLDALGARVATGDAVVWYFVGEIGKYLPGTFWPVVGRAELARRGGVARAVSYQSVVLSLLLLYLACALVGGALVGVGAAIVIVVGIAVLHPGVSGRLLELVRRVTKRDIDVVVPSLATSARLTAVYVPAWVLVGTATWAVARALDPSASWTHIVPAATASWLVGFLAVPVPGGVGVREAAFVAFATGLAPGVAPATAVIARLVFVAVDAAGAAVLAPRVRR